jgi:hypothetical protein
MTKSSERNHWSKPADTPISLPNYEYENRLFYCNNCGRNLQKLIDSGGENISYYCNTCSTETFPTEQIRSRSRLQTPDGPIEEPAVSLLPELGLKLKNKEVKGTFKKLQERGIKITDYRERGWRKQNEE